VKTLQAYINGQWVDPKAEKYYDIFDPSTGEVIAKAPCCPKEVVEAAVEAAAAAFPAWRDTPPAKRTQALFALRALIDRDWDKLTHAVAQENGKVWHEAAGDVAKVKEAVEFACGIPTLMMGDSLLNTSTGFDTVLYRESVGVFAGIAPFNFPAMIPMGWMTPLCIACGNTIVIKASSMTPMTCSLFMDLLKEAGIPDGVVNMVTCSRNEAEILLSHPSVKGVSFVGSTSVGLHVYSTAAAHGKRVQALCEAKNHALVLEDTPLPRTARAIINASFGCAGERCMALPVVVAQESIADELASLLVEYAKELKIGRAYDKESQLGPVVTAGHKEFVTGWIDKAEAEGAKLLLDGRGCKVEGSENGFYVGPTIFDHVTADMTCGDEEIFGPVLCIKRVKNFEEGIALMNHNRFANGSVIFTQNGYYAREFARRTDGGMVGVNVGIPVPVGVFPFTGHKNSFFGDLHTLGKDGVRFYTETKAVTTRWYNEDDLKQTKIGTWE